ncbi:MAG TPA: hypothetical protein VN609_05540 [Propionibacteriaceae bacterium]|nr:hypothetical protein [Propionibacteriaceae bacterium]
MSPTRERLVYRVKAAMREVPPEELTMDELRAVLPVIEGAVERGRRALANVIRLDTRGPLAVAGRRAAAACDQLEELRSCASALTDRIGLADLSVDELRQLVSLLTVTGVRMGVMR